MREVLAMAGAATNFEKLSHVELTCLESVLQ